jgi:multiple sugar transport system permease protein
MGSHSFVMLLILAALQCISSDLDEAAALYGATKMQVFNTKLAGFNTELSC